MEGYVRKIYEISVDLRFKEENPIPFNSIFERRES